MEENEESEDDLDNTEPSTESHLIGTHRTIFTPSITPIDNPRCGIIVGPHVLIKEGYVSLVFPKIPNVKLSVSFPDDKSILVTSKSNPLPNEIAEEVLTLPDDNTLTLSEEVTKVYSSAIETNEIFTFPCIIVPNYQG
jgi:hypothetical protein